MAVEITEEFVWQNIPRRARDSHKGTFGSVLAVAGSAFYRGAALLAPTKIYVKPVLAVMKEVTVKGVSHITGGGFYENIPRSLKAGCCAVIKKSDVRTPVLFDVLAKEGNIPERDMFNTFNMGVGMILTVAAEDADKAIEILKTNGEDAYRLGVIGEGSGVQLV